MEEFTHTRVGNTLSFARQRIPSGLYKLLVPAGTRLWGLSMPTGDLPVPCSAVMSLDAPPDMSRAVPVGHDYRDVLQRLWSGETLRSETPAHSGGLTISQPEAGVAWRADRDRWLYLLLDFGPYLCLSLWSRIELHADAAPAPSPLPAPAPAPAPVPPPVPSATLERRTLDYAIQSGLAAALMKTAGVHTDAELIAWARSQGELWPALCRMAALAERRSDSTTTTEGAHA